jgi:hypothetical protein
MVLKKCLKIEAKFGLQQRNPGPGRSVIKLLNNENVFFRVTHPRDKVAKKRIYSCFSFFTKT